MALKLVRQTSDTPNITNKDDVISLRYSYGGYNGVVKSFGNECGYNTESGVFTLLDGRIIIDGWEIDVDGAGWKLDLSYVTGTQYYSIYAQVSVDIESVKIDSTYLTGAYPEIPKGDDLTAIPNGTARVLLYHVKVENGTITEVVKKFNIIPYLTQKVLDIERRLEELGFKQGNIVGSDGITYKNAVSKVGYYAIIKLERLEIEFNGAEMVYLFSLPTDFIPKTTQNLEDSTSNYDSERCSIRSIVYSNSETNENYRGKLLIKISGRDSSSYTYTHLYYSVIMYGYSLV